jgi:hypothetical protein
MQNLLWARDSTAVLEVHRWMPPHVSNLNEVHALMQNALRDIQTCDFHSIDSVSASLAHVQAAVRVIVCYAVKWNLCDMWLPFISKFLKSLSEFVLKIVQVANKISENPNEQIYYKTVIASTICQSVESLQCANLFFFKTNVHKACEPDYFAEALTRTTQFLAANTTNNTAISP